MYKFLHNSTREKETNKGKKNMYIDVFANESQVLRTKTAVAQYLASDPMYFPQTPKKKTRNKKSSASRWGYVMRCKYDAKKQQQQ